MVQLSLYNFDIIKVIINIQVYLYILIVFQGLKNAHIKDGAALCSYFAWLEENISLGNLTEISAGEKLLSFRR